MLSNEDKIVSLSSRREQKKRTTRFYGVKFVESKINNDENMFTTTPGQSGFVNPREYFREVYGPFLCSLLLTSAITVVVGASLTLAGYYVPRVSVETLMSGNFTEYEAIKEVEKYDQTLNGLRTAGIVLLAIGGLGLSVLVLVPVVFLRRSEYAQLPTESASPSPVHVSPPSSNGKSPDTLNYALVQKHVQPSRKQQKSSKRLHHHRASYDKGFLSPDLNRGPIFISDDTCRIGDIKRNRSLSIGTKVSPHYEQRSRTASAYSDLELATRTPVKTGSFHSLR